MALQSEVVALDSRLVGIAGHPDIVGYLGIAAVRVVGRGSAVAHGTAGGFQHSD